MNEPQSIVYSPVVMSYQDRRQFWVGVFAIEHEWALRNAGEAGAKGKTPAQIAIAEADAALKAYVERFEKGEDVHIFK